MNIVGIYKIHNIKNHKIYIGSSIDITHRISEHKRKLINNYHENEHLQKSFNKYGIENFIFEIIEECDNTILLERESYWITYYNSYDKNLGYNFREPLNNHFLRDETILKMSEVKKGENNPMYGRKHKEETIEKQRQIKLGKTHSLETKLRIGLYSSQRVHSTETKEKISKSHKGKKFDDAHKSNISNALKGKAKSEEHRNKLSISKRGSQSGRAKLNEDQVIVIKHMIACGVRTKDIAFLFKVKPNTISSIKSNKIWSHISVYNDTEVDEELGKYFDENGIKEVEKKSLSDL
jgi:group I intron endonuclease